MNILKLAAIGMTLVGATSSHAGGNLASSAQEPQMVTCTAQNTARISFVGSGATREQARQAALRLCENAADSKGDCSILNCQN